jgi:LuxR family maltose regulon positive regulatory protein
MTAPILRTKLYLPPARPESVPRPHLVRRLDTGLRHKLILIAAPAGFGKTTLLSTWLHDCGVPFAWLSVDEGDNDPTRFRTYLIAALETLGITNVVVDGASSDALPSAPLSMEDVLAGLINQISGIGRDLILVLDDYHLITAQVVHDALSFLLEHQPRNLHLIIASRADPPLPIARLRGRSQLTELRQADLRFTDEEAATFLNRMVDLSLTADDVAALNARTEGWVTGLQMAALALQPQSATQPRPAVSDFIAAFAGSHRYILDYLLEEVLYRESEPVQTFLLQTSILDRLCGPLCDAVAQISKSAKPVPVQGDQQIGKLQNQPVERGSADFEILRFSDSQDVLEYLEHANLFIVPLDDRREWYRYHRLFSDLLQQRLHKTWPDAVRPLHHRASAWYAANGNIPSAIDHALEAEDFDIAADLIEQVAEATLMRGETATLLRWSDALPVEAICARPILCMLDAWVLLLSGRPLEVVEARLTAAEPHSDCIPGQITALRSLLAAYQIRLDVSLELARQALAELPEENILMRGFVLWILSAYGALYRDATDVIVPLDQLARIGLDSGNVLMAVSALTQLAEIKRRCGELHKAWPLYHRALELAMDDQAQRLPLAGQPLLGLGDLAGEWHDLEAAERYLLESIALSEQWSDVGALEAYLALAWVKWVQGDADGAQAAIDTARQLAIRFDATDVDDWAVALVQVRFAMAQGDLAAVQRWIETQGVLGYADASLPEEYDMQPVYRLRKYELAILARLLIAQDRPEAALDVLDRLLPVAERQQRPSLIIEIHLLKALALEKCGRRDQAMASLEQGLMFAEPEGYTRPFVDVGEAIRLLISDFGLWIKRQQRDGASERACAYAERLLVVLDDASSSSTMPGDPFLTTQFSATGTRDERNESIQYPASGIQHPLEPLSEREREVLRLLDSSLSTAEIADVLFVSVHTVRSHLKSIYSKLDVHSRYEAVAKAKEIGVL